MPETGMSTKNSALLEASIFNSSILKKDKKCKDPYDRKAATIFCTSAW